MIPPIDPLSPFEVFRTPILIRRFSQGFYFNGIWQEGSQTVLSTILITGNVVNITYNGVILSPITFTTNIATTMALIQAIIQAQPGVDQVDISADNLTITVVPLEPNLSFINSFTVTGGASKPTITLFNSPIIINATASVQPTKGKEVMLVPEGRRDQETYKMYTSTQINGVDTQNPDQVQILKSPYYPTVFEVIRIDEWQNNANFNITNHYKYICMKLQPLPGVL
jgi:hypothetical protein